jgi:hypothetical protein
VRLNDLVHKFIDKAIKTQYYGDVNLKFEAGNITVIERRQSFKADGLLKELNNE